MTDGRALLDLARSIAVVAHAGQTRKGTGEPYFNHVERVAESVKGWRARTIAYLHDTIEDTGITDEMLYVLGFPMSIVDAVLALSRQADETYRDFIERAATHHDPDVRAIKLADIRDNLRDIDILPGNPETLRRRYITAEARLLRDDDPEASA